MGFFDNRRKQKEIERLENELRVVTSKIDSIHSRRDKLNADKESINEKISKALDEDLENIRRKYGDDAVLKCHNDYTKCIHSIFRPYYGLHSGVDHNRILSSISNSLPRTAKLIPQAIETEAELDKIRKEIGDLGSSSFLPSRQRDLQQQIEQLKKGC